MKHGSSGYKSGCRCDECKAGKKADARAHYLRHREDIIAKAKRQAEANPDAVKAYKQKHYLRNREEVLAAQKDPEVRKIRAERQRAYALKNAEKVAAYKQEYNQREQTRALRLARRRSPAGKAAAHRRRGTPFTPDAVDYLSVILADPCVFCGAPSDSVDHIVPVSGGGTGDWDNVAPACMRCNAAKNNRPLLSFMLRRVNQGDRGSLCA